MGRDKKAFIASLTIHSLFACSVSERNMGQSLYLWFDSAGFCCWGLGMGRPFPAQITTQGHRGTFFRVVSQISGDRGTQLLRAAAPGGIRWVSPLDQGKTTLMRRSLITRWGGPRSETTHNVRGGQVSDWEESQMLAALAVSELPAALQ